MNLGYIPGLETAMAAFAKDVQGTGAADMYGTPVSKLPVMSGLMTAKDFSLIIYNTGVDAGAMIRQYVSVYGNKMVVTAGMGWVTGLAPYVDSGQLAGIVPGVIGGAEYELLMKSPGAGLGITDGLTLGFLLLAILAVVGNVTHYSKRPTGGVKS